MWTLIILGCYLDKCLAVTKPPYLDYSPLFETYEECDAMGKLQMLDDLPEGVTQDYQCISWTRT